VDGVEVRRAVADDLPALVALLADDPLGRSRETADLASYRRAFEQVDRDAGQLLVTAVAHDEIVGTLQLSLIPGLSRGGAVRGQIEAVRVRGDHRGRGIGSALLRWAVDEARRRGCALVQLTTDTSRADALRFYEGLGFVASHGLKMALDR
jgi:ribosomal protein S18 acetylase RimI-like enzyme